ncbi:MAG: hypothetical protein QNJ68_12270 [Microcoleaceae cyanobacterium MO_207.B10]|nr:hypothetical protein [Microcoleaceae cyanobacterium MO_207.B10]
MTYCQIESIKISIETVVENILAIGKISAWERKFLRLALFSPRSLTVTEQEQIKRVYEELNAGRIMITE